MKIQRLPMIVFSQPAKYYAELVCFLHPMYSKNQQGIHCKTHQHHFQA